MIARDEFLLDCIDATPLKTMLEDAVTDAKRHRSTPRAFQKAPASAYTHTVRSVQRMKLPKVPAEWATEQYIQWLPVGLKGLLRVRRDGNDIHFTLFRRGPTLLSLSLRNHRSEPSRNVLRVTAYSGERNRTRASRVSTGIRRRHTHCRYS